MTAEITEMCIKQETVYGGEQGLIIHTQVIQLVYMFEDSRTYIKNLTLTNMYVSRRNQNVHVNFRDIGMYGTLYNFMGWGLDGGEYDGACVPNYFLETYNNQDETNPGNKMSKLNMAKLLTIRYAKYVWRLLNRTSR